MTEKKLFLLDGMALIYRAYFALSKMPRITSYGLNTSAVFGFTNTLLEVLNNQNPNHIAVVFDTSAPTQRHKDYEEYKAHREKMPEDLAAAIPYVFRLLEGFNIPIITKDGYEADDIIGTLAMEAEKEGFQVYCMTPDKDFAQLVTENIFIYKPARMGNGAEILGLKEVLEKWEVEDPKQVIDILGLWGDSVDNIPGIPGIGEKTAKKLIKEYGSVEGIIANSDKLRGKQKENVETYAEQGLLSKNLATIILDVPVDFDEEALKREELDKEKLENLFAELEFKSIGKRVFGDQFSILDNDQKGQMNLFGNPEVSNVSNSSASEVSSEMKNIETTEHTYVTAKTDKEIQDVLNLIVQQEKVCFDTEATGVDPLTAEIVGMSFSYKKGEAYYIPLSEKREEAEKILQQFKAFFENKDIKKIGQNLKYDIILLAQYGIQVQGRLFDTMLAHYLIDTSVRHNMDLLSENYLNYSPIPIQSLIGPKGKKQKNLRQIDPERVAEYASEDADVTWQLYEKLKPILKEINALKLAEDVEFPLVYTLATMEINGVKIDKDALDHLSEGLREDILQLEKNIFEEAGVTFNIASPKQLGEVLFDKLKLDPKAKKTKTGQYKTGEDILIKLAHKSSIVQDILEFRQLNKLRSTYVEALPTLISEQTDLVHTSYNQAVTTTGRLSSTNPNLQNIPIRTERGREIRKAFVPRQQNHTILSADYSQIELRIMAELSQDKNMLEAFQKGQDIHRATAARVYGISIEEVTDDQRRNAKAVNFGIIYGQSAFGLSESLNISRKEAADIIEQYFHQYQGIQKYMSETIEFAQEHGYVETLLKRRRYLRDINSANRTVKSFAERNAINAPIQGTAADMIKIAMNNIQNDIISKKLTGKMIMQVHDELIFDVPNDEIETFEEIISTRMKSAIKMEVPILVEVGQGSNWLEAH